MLIAGVAVSPIGFASANVDLPRAFSLPSWAALLYLAVAGSCIAFFINLWLLQRIAAWIVGISSLIIPVIAVAVGVLVGGEHFGVRELLGAALVIAGVWLALRASDIF
jgi:drug/metabolite transporter (DMT)-like permease